MKITQSSNPARGFIAHLRRLLNEDIAAGEELIQAAERGAFKPSMPCRWFDPRTRNCRRRWKCAK